MRRDFAIDHITLQPEWLRRDVRAQVPVKPADR
jgi:hypothetical protein